MGLTCITSCTNCLNPSFVHQVRESLACWLQLRALAITLFQGHANLTFWGGTLISHKVTGRPLAACHLFPQKYFCKSISAKVFLLTDSIPICHPTVKRIIFLKRVKPAHAARLREAARFSALQQRLIVIVSNFGSPASWTFLTVCCYFIVVIKKEKERRATLY